MCKLHYDIQVLPNLLSLTERVGHEDQVQELVLGGGSQQVVTEVRKSKLFILAGVGGHDRQVYVQVESHTQV